MAGISVDISGAEGFYSEEMFDEEIRNAQKSLDKLVSHTGEGREFTGWVDLPARYDKDEFERIKQAAARISQDHDALVVIGIGGSYLGARAAIEFLGHSFRNTVAATRPNMPEIFFVGNQISATYMADLIEVLKERDFAINVISKSGTTTEPAIAFRLLKNLLEKKFGVEGAASRIYATTDREKGALKTMADKCGYETFVVPDDIGGRYSVMTAVGLLPIAVSGADIDTLMLGAQTGMNHSVHEKGAHNPALKYAAMRNIFYKKGKTVELFANYEPACHYIAEWWKQLYGESEGKENKGLFPASVDLTTDLHSMGQYIQDGQRIMFETVLNVEHGRHTVRIPKEENDLDGLNYLANKTMGFVNGSAMRGTALAHVDGGVPNIRINIPDMSEMTLGMLFYFFEIACGVSGYMLGVNPFDQPGVESYKKNMFALLGKPGYEELTAELTARLGRAQ
ncbi:MAG: glucose-6-phosphate isomerase [Eubacterium sp.]|nr:glucose-6-phosphate isomerase [Eubacterium sp.]